MGWEPFTITVRWAFVQEQHQALLVGCHGSPQREYCGDRFGHLHAPPHLGGIGPRGRIQRPANRQQGTPRSGHCADVLVEDHIAKIEEKIEKEVEKARKRFGESFDEAQFRTTNSRVREHPKDRRTAMFPADGMNAKRPGGFPSADHRPRYCLPHLGQPQLDRRSPVQPHVLDPNGFGERGRQRYLPSPGDGSGIFVNYLNVQKTGRMVPSFGIAQIGKAFRNEIVARQFIFRMREFEQMEMQFFIRPA